MMLKTSTSTKKHGYTRHIEFRKDVPETNPSTGKTLLFTVFDLYAYPDRIEIIGFGTRSVVRPKGGVTLERIIESKQVMAAQGFRIIGETICPAAPKRRSLAFWR